VYVFVLIFSRER